MKKGLKIVPVSSVDEVLSEALSRQPVPIEWDEEEAAALAGREAKPNVEGVVTH